MPNTILEFNNVHQSFYQGGIPLEVLCGADLTLRSGEIVALVGPSGSGKTTLLQIAGLLEQAEEGEVSILGTYTNKLSDDARTKIRSRDLGFVYQYHHLLAEFTARENIVLPQMIAGQTKVRAQAKADDLLSAMGLSNRARHRPARLSGGEQQRVAVARALANQPKLLLADEPTGSLDPIAAELVFALLLKLVKKTGISALVATHNPELAQKMDRVLYLANGKLISE